MGFNLAFKGLIESLIQLCLTVFCLYSIIIYNKMGMSHLIAVLVHIYMS